jgi:hypothetical protein
MDALLPCDAIIRMAVSVKLQYRDHHSIHHARTMSFTFTIAANRTTGFSPLTVVFNVLDAASSETTNEFHDCDFRWDFGDTAGDINGATQWSYGTRTTTHSVYNKASRNMALGPIAAHTFEIPLDTASQEFTVTCHAWDGVTYVSDTITITVTGQNSQFSGTNTIVVSPTSDFSDAPSGASTSTASTIGGIGALIATGKRVLLNCGESWTGTAGQNITATNFVLGAYGTGAKPILKTSSTGNNSFIFSMSGTNSQVTFIDLDVDGESAGNRAFLTGSAAAITNLTILRCDLHHVSDGVELAEDNSTSQPNGQYFIDSTIQHLRTVAGNTPVGLRFMCENMAVMGSLFDDSISGTSEHMLRTHWTYKGVYSNNKISNVADGKELMAIREVIDTTIGKWSLTGDNITTKYVVISENELQDNTGVGIQMSINGAGDYPQAWRDIIIESNWINNVGSTNPSFPEEAIRTLGDKLSVRNNMFTGISNTYGVHTDAAGSRISAGQIPDSTNVWSYHNSMASDGTNVPKMIYMQNGSSHIAKSNLGYVPNATSPVMTEGTMTESDNSTDAEMDTTSPSFNTFPPTTPAHLALQSGSYARNNGATGVKVFRDFFGNFRDPAVVDMGAAAFTLGNDPAGSGSSAQRFIWL